MIPVSDFYIEGEIEASRVQFRVLENWLNDSLISLSRFRMDDVNYLKDTDSGEEFSSDSRFELYMELKDSLPDSVIEVHEFPRFQENEVVEIINEYSTSEAYFIQSDSISHHFQIDYKNALAEIMIDSTYISLSDALYSRNPLLVGLNSYPKFWMIGDFKIDGIRIDSLAFSRISLDPYKVETSTLNGSISIPSIEREYSNIDDSDTVTFQDLEGTLFVKFVPKSDRMRVVFQGKTNRFRISNSNRIQNVRVRLIEELFHSDRAEIFWLFISGVFAVVFGFWNYIKKLITA